MLCPSHEKIIHLSCRSLIESLEDSRQPTLNPLFRSQDVAAATFMAIATSAPEFFVNCVGTFVTESDIGVGTVVGSAMFNTLGVAALGGLAASKVNIFFSTYVSNWKR